MTQSACTHMTTRTLTQRLADRIGSHKYDMWFDRTAKLTVSAERVEVATGSQFVADWIASHFSDDLRGVASEALGRPADVHIHVDPDLFDQDSTRREHRPNGSQTPEKTDRVERSTPEADRSTKPNRNSPRRRLDDFVVGQSNELAFCASTRLAESQSTAEVSPLFLHGDCGVGKTHLLQGICQRFAERGNRGAVRYVTAEQFTNEFIASVRNGHIEAFRQRTRRLDLLAIDDVHFLSNKVATQNEFLYTLDAIDLSGARVVMASDEHPRQMRFSAGLISRFVAGMVVQIHRPDRETRIELAQRLASTRGLRLTDAASEILASHCLASVRELEGAINKLAALRSLSDRPVADGEVGALLVQQLFNDGAWRPKMPIKLKTVVEVVCDRLGVNRADLMGSGRHRRVVLARGLVAYLGRMLTTLSYPEIAHAMGRRHHSTVHTAAKRVTGQLEGHKTIDLSTVGLGAGVSLAELVDQLRHLIVRAAPQR